MRPALLHAALALSLGGIATVASAADDDRFTFRASAFDTDASIRVGAEGTVGNEDINATFDDVGVIDGSETALRFEAVYHPAERHRLALNYYDLEPRESYVLDRDIGFEEFPEYTLPAGSRADVGMDFKLATLMYEYAFVESDTWTVGGQVGVHWAQLVAFGSVDIPDIASDRVEWKRTKRAIALGARAQYRPSDRWRFGLEVQGYDTSWGDFVSENGHFERAGLLAEYRFTDRFGVHVGYDWFRLKLRDVAADEDEYYSVLLDGELKVHGPTAGLTLAF